MKRGRGRPKTVDEARVRKFLAKYCWTHAEIAYYCQCSRAAVQRIHTKMMNEAERP